LLLTNFVQSGKTPVISEGSGRIGSGGGCIEPADRELVGVIDKRDKREGVYRSERTSFMNLFLLFLFLLKGLEVCSTLPEI
jgi:hypothetical protein